LKEQDYEDKIWKFASELRSKTSLWHFVAGDKKTCFDVIDKMVQTSQLKEVKEQNRKLYVRIDYQDKTEFESNLDYQVEALKKCRDYISKLKKPLFKIRYTVIHTEPPLTNLLKIDKKFRTNLPQRLKVNWKKYKIVEEIPIYRPVNRNITKAMKTMSFYQNALLLFISRSYLQDSLNIVGKTESKRRIEKCEKALNLNFKKLLSDNPKDSKALRQYLQFDTYKIENFKI